MMRKLTIATLLSLAAFAGALPASAEPAPTASKVSVGALAGYGFEDGLNLGLGLRAGYTLPMNLYLGGTFVYHLGKTESTPFGDVSANIYYFGAEGGYDIAAGPVVIRPYLGLGSVTIKAPSPGICFDPSDPSMCTPSLSASESKFGTWPGATLIYPIGSAFIGGDARYLIVSESNAFSVFATGGMMF